MFCVALVMAQSLVEYERTRLNLGGRVQHRQLATVSHAQSCHQSFASVLEVKGRLQSIQQW